MGLKNASVYGLALGMFALVISTSANAQSKKGKATPAATKAAAAPASQPAADEKVDISDLENKYWAPKDPDFSVVQNRTYSKVKSLFLTPQMGTLVNDPWSEGNVYGVTANYFWSERYGIQATYLSADLQNKKATDDLAVYGSGVQPDHGKLAGYYGVGFNLVPFYAKMSFWGKHILYFDMAFTPTVGMTQYDQIIEGGNKSKSAFTYGFDVTQYFFFAKWFAVRLDLKNQWHSEEVVKFRNSTGMLKGQNVEDKNIQDTLFLLGASFYW